MNLALEAIYRCPSDDIISRPSHQDASHGWFPKDAEPPDLVSPAMEHLLHFVLDITKSVARHGFKRILIADGHGSNMPILDLVARRTILETDSLCATFIWPSLAIQEIRKVRESERGGMAHACELETSVANVSWTV